MRCGLFVVAVVVGIIGFNPEGRAWSDTEIRAAIGATLKIRHPNETREWWRSLGTHTPNIIISMFKEESSIYHQIRLVDALAWFDDAATLEFLKDQAAHHSNPSVRRSAMRSVGLSQGVKEKEFLKKNLQSSDLHTRLAAAKLLEDLKDPSAKQRALGKENKLIIEGKGKTSGY